MLAAAKETGAYSALDHADIARWTPPAPPALIFSNAVCHWLPDHAALLRDIRGESAAEGPGRGLSPRYRERAASRPTVPLPGA